jgi:hypothetical protein
MGHILEVDYKDLTEFTNDPHIHLDEEYTVFKILNDYWDVNNTKGIRPQFFLTEKIITHDLSISPAILVYNSDEKSTGQGITYPSKSAVKTLTIDIKCLDRNMLFDTRDEVVRVLDYCRKYPIPHWDFVSTLSMKRDDPRPGNNHAYVYIRFRKLVEYIPAVVFPEEEALRQAGTKIEIISPTPSMHVGSLMSITAVVTSTQTITGVTAYIDNIQIGSAIVSNTPFWSYSTSTLTNTAHQLIVKAETTKQIGTDGVLFIVNN